MRSSPTTRIEPGLALLAVAAFLLPLIGGQVAVETVPFSGGALSLLNSLFGGPEIPTFSHFILTLCVVGAFVLLALSRRIVQTPNPTFSASLAIFFAILVGSTVISSFKSLSISTAAEWLVYGFAAFAVVGLAGRRIGPLTIVGGLFAGCVVAALKGIHEYGDNKDLVPPWRIFGGWNNPNALAAVLLIGFFLGLGLLLTQERLKALAAGFGTVLIGIALWLTQSKGALLMLAIVGLLWAAVAAGLWFLDQRADRRPAETPNRPPEMGGGMRPGISLGRTGAVLATVALAAVLLLVQQRAVAARNGAASGVGGTSRLISIGDSADQSAGFRKLLWQTSLDLIKGNPAGYGIGTFRSESGRPGLTTQTVFAHSTYLQLGVEGSPVLPLAYLLAIVLWLRLAFRGIRKLPSARRTLLLSVISAVGAVLAHSFIDSDVYYFGVGLALFMLFGVGLLLSADAVAPEFLFPTVRRIAAAFALFILTAVGYFAGVEYLTASARGELDAQNSQGAIDTLNLLHHLAPMASEPWYISAGLSGSMPDALTYAQSAVDAAPNTRNLRLLARMQKSSGQTAAAAVSFERALVLDPNNFATLYQLAQLQRENGDTSSCVKTLTRLVAVENSNYFKIRSLPELIPTETYQARIELADESTNRGEQRRLLREAVAGYHQFLDKTIPNVLRMSKLDPPMDYGGISVEVAKEKLKAAADAAQRLSKMDAEAGDAAGAAAADKDATDFLGGIK